MSRYPNGCGPKVGREVFGGETLYRGSSPRDKVLGGIGDGGGTLVEEYQTQYQQET